MKSPLGSSCKNLILQPRKPVPGHPHPSSSRGRCQVTPVCFRASTGAGVPPCPLGARARGPGATLHSHPGSRLPHLQPPAGWEPLHQFFPGASAPFGALGWRNDLERFRAGALRCVPGCRASALHGSALGLLHASSSSLRTSWALVQQGWVGAHPSSYEMPQAEP